MNQSSQRSISNPEPALSPVAERRGSALESPPDWAEYERLKRELPECLTAAEYTNACRRLAAECGL